MSFTGRGASWRNSVPIPFTPDRDCIQNMTPHQVRLVRNSFKLIEPIAAEAGEAFYRRLFEIAPEVRQLFPDNMEGQHAKLVNVLGVVISNLYMISLPVTTLREAETFMPQVRALGRRHVRYGIGEAHFAKVGEALIWTLKAYGGEAFTDEVEEAWLTIFDLISRVMLEGLKEQVAAGGESPVGRGDSVVSREESRFLERFNMVTP